MVEVDFAPVQNIEFLEPVSISQASPDLSAPSIVRFGQADFTKTLIDRATNAIVAEDIEKFNPEERELHGQALEVFSTLEKNPKNFDLLTQYCETLEWADFRLISDSLGAVRGAEQIAEVARGNYYKQADRLLVGASEINETGRAIVTNFGTPRSFHSQEEIMDGLREIGFDMRRVQERIMEHYGSSTPLDIATITGQLEKYMYDGKNLENELGKATGTLIIQDHESPGFIDILRDENIIDDAKEIHLWSKKRPKFQKGKNHTIFLPEGSRFGFEEKLTLCQDRDSKTNNFFLSFGDIPKTVILQVPTSDSFSGFKNNLAYQNLFIDWFRLPYKDRPRVIVYTEGFQPQLIYPSSSALQLT